MTVTEASRGGEIGAPKEEAQGQKRRGYRAGEQEKERIGKSSNGLRWQQRQHRSGWYVGSTVASRLQMQFARGMRDAPRVPVTSLVQRVCLSIAFPAASRRIRVLVKSGGATDAVEIRECEGCSSESLTVPHPSRRTLEGVYSVFR